MFALVVTSACRRTEPDEHLRSNGFLADYSMLQPGEEGQMQQLYINPNLGLDQYSRILIEPVTVWRSPDSPLEDLDVGDLDELADYALYAFHKQLHHDFQLVQSPGANTMALRVAVTEASEAPIVLATASSRIPRLHIMTPTRALSDDASLFLSEASIEIELVDTLTGERIAAAVDRRAGQTVFRGEHGEWVLVDSAFVFWAERLKTRLKEAGFGAD